MSGAHFINYERKKSGAHVFLEERVISARFFTELVMSAKLSNEQKKRPLYISANLNRYYLTLFMYFKMIIGLLRLHLMIRI